MEPLRYRYPGIKPFETSERSCFFGRAKETQEVCRLLDLDNLVVLHGPSGIGKSSIINAGILPVLEQVRNWDVPHEIIQIRFSNYDPYLASLRKASQRIDQEGDEQVKDPVDRFLEAYASTDTAWDQEIPMHQESFWLAAKKLLFDKDQPKKRLVFVLDQFEELFTYPEKRVEEFARLLGELYHQEQPESVRKALERKKIIDQETPLEITPEAAKNNRKFLAFLEEDLDIKILISMRSDKLNFLERFKPYLPEIMMSSFELRSFDQEQAIRAIKNPAIMDGKDFASPKWVYDDQLIEVILEFIQDKLTRRIDPSQLQIICQHLEKQAIDKAEKANKPKKSFLDRILHA